MNMINHLCLSSLTDLEEREWLSPSRMMELALNSSAGTNVYFPHSKVLLLKRTNVRIVCFA